MADKRRELGPLNMRSNRPHRKRNPEHEIVVGFHLDDLRDDEDFQNLPYEQQQGRIRAETRGLYVFLESGIQAGEYVQAEYRSMGIDHLVEGILEIIQDSEGLHPMALRVEGQRVRFRCLNWIRRI